ncbi:methyltransferase [Colletotrichum karsti]|uniref:Methyltransferase n=1 Tax=Colletotrichum karsti TaxID=1095194 RepID=A0A9P6IIE9_9PEZI|nr:methyltransferase [Colletotrichum karsti]KAF9881766.1 methyltransferase [Colletotrichum karsti]
MDGYVKFTKDRDDNMSEKARLGDQHEILLHAMRGRAILAPVDLSRPSLRILDSGAADGRWLTDLRSSIGGDSHEYVGTDIDPSLYPSSPPEDVYFCNQSIRKPFPDEWQGTFDVVHQRLVMAAVAPPDSTITSATSNLAGLLRPGGWLQLVELDNECVNDNGPAMRRLLRYHQQNSAAGGLGPNLSVHLTRAMQDAGLKGVEERSVDVMYGARNKGGRDLRMKSMMSLYGAVGPVLAQAKRTYIYLSHCVGMNNDPELINKYTSSGNSKEV